MPRDNIHHGGWEHRDVHNINGMLFVRTSLNPLDFTHCFLVTSSFRPTKLTTPSITALTLPNVPSCLPVLTMPVPNGLRRCGLVTTWVLGNTWQ